jgi:hypothetical protein
MLGPSALLLSAAGAVICGALVIASRLRSNRTERLPRISAICQECFETYHDLPAWEGEGFVCERCRNGGRKTP